MMRKGLFRFPFWMLQLLWACVKVAQHSRDLMVTAHHVAETWKRKKKEGTGVLLSPSRALS
jgi:hypothetical protein